MNKIKIENSSPLCSLQHKENKKLVLDAGRNFKWMTPEDIEEQKGQGLGFTDSLADIARQLGNAEFKVDQEEALENLLINLNFIDKKVKRHNSSIDSSFLYFIDVVLNFVTVGSFRLKYHSISEQVRNREEACKKSLSEHTEYRSSLLKKYSETPELLSDLSELWKALVESLKSKSDLTHKEISHLLKIYPDFPKAPSSILSYLAELEKIKDFITQNKALIELGTIGYESKKNSQILKFKADQHKIPNSVTYTHSVSYNRENGDVVANFRCPIGVGACKVIKKKMNLLSYQMLAVSKQRLEGLTEIDRRYAVKEIQFMKKLKGKPYVLQLHHAYVYHSVNKGEVQLTMTEFCNMGDLERNMKSLTKNQKIQVAKGMIRGVLEAHKAGIIHRDLKPENFFLKLVATENGEEEIVVVLGDFGMACWAEGDTDILIPIGTRVYMAPGIARGESPASFSSDAWSVGAIFLQLFVNSNFSQFENWTLIKAEPSDKESIEYVIWMLLQHNVEKRMKLEDALVIFEKLPVLKE